MAADPSIVRFRAVVEGALQHLESRRQEINDLNVFPVADGDTGDNMALTLRAVIEELDRLADGGSRSLDEIGRDEIVQSVAPAALLGARGNSGVILSQLVRGAAEELISRPGELVDPVLVAAALHTAAQRAYGSVREPVEGTMLTVMRDMATALSRELAHSSCALEGDADAEVQNDLIATALERAIEAGGGAGRRGGGPPAALREAGVVDSGGYAVVVIFAGVVAALRGAEAPELDHYAGPVHRPHAHGDHASETYRYCTNFAVSGGDLQSSDWQAALAEIGDSILVVGDAHTLKVHVHTDEPDAAMALFADAGEVSHTDVADMHQQVQERAERLSAPHVSCAVAVVASGSGLMQIYEAQGAVTIDGGPTLNPSTEDMLSTVEAINADAVLLLTSSPNVIMAADRAADLAERDVRVVPTTTQQASLAAALAVVSSASADENLELVQSALSVIRTGGVAPAAREDPAGRFAVGDAVGYVGDELVAWGSPQSTLAAVIERLADGAELLTCLNGENTPMEVNEDELPLGDAELELQHGGQPAWWWLLSAE